MKILFVCASLLLAGHTCAQTTAEYSQILNRYEQWKALQYKTGTYVTPANCKPEVMLKDGYKGPESGIPKDISIHYTDLNADGKMDALISFNPIQCDGGNSMMNLQSRVLILSKGTTWIADDKFVEAIETKHPGGWFWIEGAMNGSIFGTYYEHAVDDPRCCPSIKKPFSIDFTTKKIDFQ